MIETAFKLFWAGCFTIILGCITAEIVFKVEQDNAYSCTFHRGGDLGSETVINP